VKVTRKVPHARFVCVSLLAAASALLLGACGGSSGGARACTPGVSAACSCSNGLMGAQVCSADGASLGACACAVMGQGGAGGQAGGGGGATAGRSGVGGMGGINSAGQSGGGGTGGSTFDGGSSGHPALTDAAVDDARSADALDSASANLDSGEADLGPPVDASVPDGSVATPVPDAGGGGRLVTVEIVDAVIAPGKHDGTDWDGLGSVDPSVSQAITVALVGPNPLADVLSALTNPALAAVDKPDPYGSAQLTVYGMITDWVALATSDDAVPNTFTPIWPYDWHYQNIPIDTDVRIRIDLWDKDLIDDDPIGSVVVNSNDLKAALAAQKKLEVQVSDQSDQLLFVGINVVEQLGPQP
jgi:hypothetical protein